MSRVSWKGPYKNEKFLYNNNNQKEIKQCSRNSTITPNMVGLYFLIHNGKNLLKIKVLEEMVGYKFGEFSPTRKKFSFKKKKKNGAKS
jgi:small subunit ribosomal protein S19